MGLNQVEATGVEKIVDDSINYVRRGGTLMVYGVYADKARVHWPPSKIFGDEIRVSFAHPVLLRVMLTLSLSECDRLLALFLRPSASLVQLNISTVAKLTSKAWLQMFSHWQTTKRRSTR